MKKIYLFFVVLAMANVALAQTPRKVLVEEFTGETCPPCAISNPGFNALLNTFPENVIPLKYQNDIPSAGPNFYQYGMTDIDARGNFYANTYSPHGFVDGNYWEDNVASLTAATLTARAAMTSPFSIEVSHSFSPGNDIIYVHAVIHVTGAVTGTNYKARIAVSERDVYGYTSPNGESEYADVMRKMLPNASGVAITSLALGDSTVLDYDWTITPGTGAIDTPIWALLEAIVWVQNDATKEVMQAEMSPAQIAIDAKAIELQMGNAISCTGNVTPTLVVKNDGASPITALEISYDIDGGTPTTYNWSGTIAPGTDANISLTSIAMAGGVHTGNAEIVTANGVTEMIIANNSASGTGGQVLAAVTSYSQNFLPINFGLMNWVIENPDGGPGWSRVANTATPGSGSAKADFWNSGPGEIDYLYSLNAMDFTSAPSPELRFKVAHKRYSANENDKLEVVASTDCGATWTQVWMKQDIPYGPNALATVAAFTGNQTYNPATADWRLEVVNLSQFIGQSNVIIGFKATSDYGNNVYIDEVNIAGVTGIAETNPNLFSMYPVPSKGEITLNLSNIANNDFTISVTSIEGQLVKEAKGSRAGNEYKLDLSDLSTGTYFLKIVSGNETSVKKVVIEK